MIAATVGSGVSVAVAVAVAVASGVGGIGVASGVGVVREHPDKNANNSIQIVVINRCERVFCFFMRLVCLTYLSYWMYDNR